MSAGVNLLHSVISMLPLPCDAWSHSLFRILRVVHWFWSLVFVVMQYRIFFPWVILCFRALLVIARSKKCIIPLLTGREELDAKQVGYHCQWPSGHKDDRQSESLLSLKDGFALWITANLECVRRSCNVWRRDQHTSIALLFREENQCICREKLVADLEMRLCEKVERLWFVF